MSEESHVAYQNKDIAAKYLAEHFSDKSFAAYGVKVPRIEAAEKAVKKAAKRAKEATEKATKKAAKENETEIVKRMLANNIPLEQVKAVVIILTEDEINNLQKAIL
ncbi:hypothetical protein DWX43_16210 [Clostridium sp. AF19-22AC]|uniref:hypothetical protein n=1 Tax=Clostridia TaxID=186801 RepID=UPI000E52A0EB|nr:MULTISPECIES: hypothetical protein [Clostridia]RHR26231.1 hypothetical protein DWX43_16210 [Clostridium sp. AF19-22AC]